MKKVCFVVPYFGGKWLEWFPFYLKSCEFSPTINWLFYTDCPIPENPPQNTMFVKATMEDFNKLASKKLGFEINIKRPYKLCDFKPAYGLIFGDYLKGYDFWGHTDTDMIYGNVRKFIDGLPEKYDVISAGEKHMSGPFSLYKNSYKTNSLFKKNPDYRKIFQDEKHYSFTEVNKMGKELYSDKPISEERLKMYNMTWIVKDQTKKGYIKSYFDKLDYDIKERRFNLRFVKGAIKDYYDGEEIMFKHFRLEKKYFISPKFNKDSDVFHLNEYGISYSEYPSLFGRIKVKSKKLFRSANHGLTVYADSLIGKFGIFIKKYNPGLYHFIKKYI